MSLPRLLLVTDRRRTPRPLPDAVELALAALPPGAAGIVLREKDLGSRELLALARDVRAVTKAHDSPLFVNGRLDVAILADADGVHLGGDAPPYSSVRPALPPAMRVGISLHGEELPPASASYATLSPIFGASTKAGVRPIGVAPLRERASLATNTPLYALGGVDATNAARCLRAGAHGVAVLAAVLPQPDPADAARRLYDEVRAAARPRRA